MSRRTSLSPLTIIGASFIVGAVAMMVAWVATGMHFATQYQVAVEVTVVDEDFGDEITTTEMRDQFRLGLTPDRPWDGAGTNAAFFLVVGGALLFAARRTRREDGGPEAVPDE